MSAKQSTEPAAGPAPATNPRRAHAGSAPFAAYIAHELGTALATQRALLELALTDPDADIAAFQATHPQTPAALGGLPGETLYDSDPHDMVAYRGGYAIADAAANDVVWVHDSDQVTLLARLPTRPETALAGSDQG